jgi:hypothetical protein
MGQILHGSATTTEAVRRAIPERHIRDSVAYFNFGSGLI